ncbi:MAG: phosphatidylcholine/phosphatidylserine synthase [Kiritimatiellae bacterium]|nr:phosphatidylcholine/phosphatidylserine synthase [Kiritimatiellia bacterium]
MGKFRLRGQRRRNRALRARTVPLRAMVPNLVTSLAACAGITSMTLSSEGRFGEALVALLVACVCDGMDGRIARLLKASSKLGAELDSLADFVNFGVAPALFMFFWLTGGPTHVASGGHVNPTVVRMVLGCSLFYAMCDCFRLARFNTMLEETPLPYWKHFFTGVPAPGGCWMVLTPYILLYAFNAPETSAAYRIMGSPWFGMGMLLFVGTLMASRLPTISLKAIHIPKRAQRPVLAFALLLVASLFIDLWMTLGILGAAYVLTVPLTGLAFLKAKARYERGAGADQAKNIPVGA